MSANLYHSWLTVRICAIGYFGYLTKGMCPRQLQYLLKAQEDCDCAQIHWSILDWRNQILFLLWSSARYVHIKDRLLSLENIPCLFWPSHPPLKKLKSVVSVILATILGAFFQESDSLYPLNSTLCCSWMYGMRLAKDHVAACLSDSS